ncbi:MAG: hypothetical protein ACM3ZB_04100 [bacterium]
MTLRFAAALAIAAALGASGPAMQARTNPRPPAQAADPTADEKPVPPGIGKPEIMPVSEVRPGMKGVAWTVFSGSEPEPVPIEIIGLYKNAWGPKQDVILARMFGKALRTNVAGGMSGSPVYVDGKLIGAVALRLSVFSPDAICGITPIELMLEINDYDTAVPAGARTPDKGRTAAAALELPGGMAARVAMAGGISPLPEGATLVPIDTPLAFSGFNPAVIETFSPLLRELGINAVQGGAASTAKDVTPAPGWQEALKPGEAVAGVLVSGDMSITGLGTVTYNDGERVLAFGHAFFNLGPVDMPMSRGEILLTNASSYQPNKIGNATEIAGALKQDRHSGVMGVPGATAEMVPVTVNVRSLGDDASVRRQREFRFNVFVHQKWTPYLMMMTLLNSISELNDYRDECTYRVNGTIELADRRSMQLTTMQASSEMQVPTPMVLAGWWGDKFNRLFMNAVNMPRLKRVDATVDLLPDRRLAEIESAWTPGDAVTPGEEIPVKVFLRPYRGQRIERSFKLKVPANLERGQHRLLLSDAETLNRMQTSAGFMNRFIDLPEVISLLNKERSNDKLYVSLVRRSPTIYYEDKTLPGLPASVLNVIQTGRSGRRPFATVGESAIEQTAIPFDYVVSGSYSLNLTVK